MEKPTKDSFGRRDAGEEVRINKYLSGTGICSRREADALVAAGKVLIDGVPAGMGDKVAPGQKVTVAGKEAVQEKHVVLIAFNKPQGIVCTADRREPDNIVDYINYGTRIFPIGRLDKDSEGLILLTNDGGIVNKILRAGNGHEKEYIVQVNKPLTAEFLQGMAGGVPILDTVTKPCQIEAIDKMTFRIVLTQGLNRQIRRMCEYFDYRVRALMRVRIMNIKLGRLKTGTWRNLTEWELEELNKLLENSSNSPAAEAAREEKPAKADGMPGRKVPDKKVMDEKALDKRELGKKESDKKALDKRAPGKKVLDEKVLDRRAPDKKVMDEKALDKRELGKKESDKKALDKRASDKKVLDKKALDKRAMDKKVLDKKTLDKRVLDKKVPDKRTPDRPHGKEKTNTAQRKTQKHASQTKPGASVKSRIKGEGWTKKKESAPQKGKRSGQQQKKKDGAVWKKSRNG